MERDNHESVQSAKALASSSQGLAELTHPTESDVVQSLDSSMGCTNVETIDLGGHDLVDELNAALVAARPKPRGLLPVPQEVEAAIADADALLLREHGIVATPADRQRQLNSLTLQFYYGGQDVAYRLMPQGVELLAAGLTEINRLVQGMSQEELLTVKIGQP